MAAELEPADAEEAKLIAAALAARQSAYAPYSKFHVGAAIRERSGAVHTGCNVENAAYPLGQCAEATAIGAMALAGGRQIAMIAVVGPEDAACPPCGGCRQRIREFADENTRIIVASAERVFFRGGIEDLLPGSFSPDALDI